MSVADIVVSHYDHFNRADWLGWQDLLTDDFIAHHASAGTTVGRGAYFDGLRLHRTAFPDATVELHRVIVQGDLAAAHFTSRGTFSAEFVGIPPTGRRWDLAGMGFYRSDGARLAEAWFAEDFTGWLASLQGAME
ncbi:ester cyclase [Mycobacterium simiae]|uniref:ester cyclase n=1 Tax=Mycobacterium simiae TaxID=1784 RepID=UPI002629D233|nr:ester cyclase [Mycobacterium simiae]